MSEESHFLQPKLTFAELGIQLVLPQLLQHQTQMCLMLLLILGIDQYIINENHNELVQELHKHLVHHIHEVCRSISQSKGHNSVLIQPIPCSKGCLRNIPFSNLQLMITRTKIDLGEYTSSLQLVKQIINHCKGYLFLIVTSFRER